MNRPDACERCGALLRWVGGGAPRRCDREPVLIAPAKDGETFYTVRGPLRGHPGGTVEAWRIHACERVEERREGAASKALRRMKVEASIAAMKDPEASAAGSQLATMLRMKRYVRALQRAKALAEDVLRDVGDDVPADLRRRLEALAGFAVDPKDEA